MRRGSCLPEPPAPAAEYAVDLVLPKGAGATNQRLQQDADPGAECVQFVLQDPRRDPEQGRVGQRRHADEPARRRQQRALAERVARDQFLEPLAADRKSVV